MYFKITSNSMLKSFKYFTPSGWNAITDGDLCGDVRGGKYSNKREMMK